MRRLLRELIDLAFGAAIVLGLIWILFFHPFER